MIRVIHIRDIFSPWATEPVAEIPWQEGLHPKDLAPREFDLEAGNVILMGNRALDGEEVDQATVPDDVELVFGEVPRIAEALAYRVS